MYIILTAFFTFEGITQKIHLIELMDFVTDCIHGIRSVERRVFGIKGLEA
jgi:hypothetical protein